MHAYSWRHVHMWYPERASRATVRGIRETGVYVVQGHGHVGYSDRSICGIVTGAYVVESQEHMCTVTRSYVVEGQEHMCTVTGAYVTVTGAYVSDRSICGTVTGSYVVE